MCGIAGFVGTAEIDPARIERTLERMNHRGPDHQAHQRFRTPDGRWVDLLHARLSIFDLNQRGNQPFHRGGQWLTYNGEVYNHVEVRRDLERRGLSFRTDCDTEVLLAALVADGEAALDYCEGMWAFATFDEVEGDVLLCRDRFGEKPLYLHRAPEGIYFASEPKFIFALRGRQLPVNQAHLRRYLINGYKSLYKGRDTFFEGLEQLPPGATLRIGVGNDERLGRYWDPGAPRPDDGMTFDDAAHGVRERLIEAVELRTRADVPLAFSMSGGVDSLSLISIASRVLGQEVRGFTIVNDDARYEEQDMVDHAVAELGVNHTGVTLDTADFLPRLRTLVRHHDAPVNTISHFVQWLLMRSIAEHGFRIELSGTAADELFSGYYDHHLWYLRAVHGDPELHAASRAAWERHVKPIVRNPFLQDPDRFVRDGGFRDHIFLGADEFAGYLHDGAAEPFSEHRYTDDTMRNRMLNELFAEAVPVILNEEDLNAMFFSIENRTPFLDRELFEFSLTIPTKLLVRDGRAKAVLREAMRGIAPQRVLDNRRKVGFNAPIHSLLDSSDPAVRDELLGDSPVWDLVKRDRIEALLGKDELPNSESKFLFYFTCAKLFLEEAGA
jgi:asparagine synthase (glutamine-hydrolysing)